jgi:hypothetical protein
VTVYTIEGIMVLVVVYTLGTVLLVFYFKWREATTKLNRLRHSFGEKPKANTISPTADTKPITRGQIEPLSKTGDTAAPMMAPHTKLRRIPLKARTMLRQSLSRHKGGVNQ